MKNKDYAQDWLLDGGYALGYTWSFLPEMEDMSWIIRDKFKAEHYRNFQSREQHRDWVKLTGGLK